MTTAGCLLTRDQLQCSICLDVLRDAVTLPCGHNFCNTCITEHWDNNTDSCQCPNCNEVFRPKPELQVNTLISVVAAQFRQSAQQETNLGGSERNVQCDVCSKTKQKMFVLVFLTCVWMSKVILDHRTRGVVPLEEDCGGKKIDLVKAEAEIEQMIQQKQLKIQEIKQLVELSHEATRVETAVAVEVFTALMESVEKSLAKLIETIKQKQRATEKKAEGFLRALEDEISELKQKRTEVELPAVAQPEKTLSRDMEKLLDKAELKRVQQYTVDVTLDPNTAYPWLILSDDLKKVKRGYLINFVPDYPKRFTNCPSVLGKQSFSKGRFYYEVGVKGNIDWELGLVRESIDRKSDISMTPQDGYWTIGFHNGRSYFAVADSLVELSLTSYPEKVGMFVDYEDRLVSFYDTDTADLIYSFTGCSFTEKLYPYFHLFNRAYDDFASLIISPVTSQ